MKISIFPIALLVVSVYMMHFHYSGSGWIIATAVVLNLMESVFFEDPYEEEESIKEHETE